MSPLPSDFQLSQSTLQDFVDCERRFELKYRVRQQWPALDVEPILEKEQFIQQGATFHRMVQQHIMGLPAENMLRNPANSHLNAWWAAFKATGLDDLPPFRTPEKLLSIRLGNYPLVAKCDLIAVDPGERFVIVDWKTSRRHPKRDRLEKRLQTRIYRYVAVRAGMRLNEGLQVAPEQVEMRYWFANFPDQPINFTYNQAQYEEDERYLLDLIARIESRETFPLTPDERQCKFCLYRSLCGRGEYAGTLDEADDWMLDDAIDDEPPITELEF